MKKVIIIDDESAGRKLIRDYLVDFPDLIPVQEANNGVDAIKVIREFKPDLIFLDIQMPGLNGFEVLKHLEEIPRVIFSTAYDQYAVEAFEVHAVDYLLKPYTKARFRKAIEKLQNNQPVKQLVESLLKEETVYQEKILVERGRKLVALNARDIVWVQADGDYARIITSEARHLSNHGIGVLEERLDPRYFLRIHRSSLININCIKEVEKLPNGYIVLLDNGDQARVSRGYMDAFRKMLL